MTTETNLERLEHAIKSHLKVNLQMTDTPDEKYIVFHPYALLLDPIDGYSIVGLVEQHHTSPDVNYIKRPKLAGIKSAEVADQHFEPDHNLWKDLNTGHAVVQLEA